MRHEARQRRPISRRQLTWLSPFVRYSLSRDAYVLKGVGQHIGPVFKLVDEALPAVSRATDR